MVPNSLVTDYGFLEKNLAYVILSHGSGLSVMDLFMDMLER